MAEETKATDEPIADGSEPYAGWPEEVRAPENAEGGKKKRKKRRPDEGSGPLSINSLMDIVTIILVYLLKSYATSPIEVKDPAIQLPTSLSQETVEDAAVVMVTGPVTRALDGSGRTVAKPNTPTLVVNEHTLFGLEARASADGKSTTYRIPDNQKADAGGFVVNALKAELVKARETQEIAAEINDREFTGKVVILADKATPYRVLMDILVTCGQAGFGEFKFAIVKGAG